jgi:hypothetical protein
VSGDIATVAKGRPTPGPWRIYGPQPDTLGGRHLTILAGTGKARFGVADIRIIDPNDALEASANATLIVAAPEMLSMLETLEWGGQVDHPQGGTEDGCPYCGAAKRWGHVPDCKLAALLAKARGDA